MSPPGALVCVGEPYATLELLDEGALLFAEIDLEIVASLAPVGSLVDFDMPIVQARRRPPPT